MATQIKDHEHVCYLCGETWESAAHASEKKRCKCGNAIYTGDVCEQCLRESHTARASEIRRAVDDQGRPIGHTAARASEPKRVGPPSLLADEIARERAAQVSEPWTTTDVLRIWTGDRVPKNDHEGMQRIADAHNASLQPTHASERVFDQIEGARNCIKKGFYAQADLILSDILSLPAARARSEIRRAVDDQGRPIGHTAARASEQE